MVGADEDIPKEAVTPGAEAEEKNRDQNRSPPPAHTNYWPEEDRVRDMLSKCYDVGILPSGWDIGEIREDGNKAQVILNPSLDKIKVKWLKEKTVTVIFLEGSKNLPKKLKEEVIRAFEDIWLGEKRFDEVIMRGRVCIESSNVLSYVAKDKAVTEWMFEEKEIRVALRGRWYSMAFKPWMTKAEIQDARRDEDRQYFWIRVIDVPIDTYCYLEAAAEGAIGPVRKVYPPEQDARTPRLINVRLDIAIEVLSRLKESFEFTTFQGQVITVQVAHARSPWCSKCRRFFHLADQCPRRQRRRSPSPTPNDANPLFQSPRVGRDIDVLLDLVIELDLADVFRVVNPEDVGYTWFHPGIGFYLSPSVDYTPAQNGERIFRLRNESSGCSKMGSSDELWREDGRGLTSPLEAAEAIAISETRGNPMAPLYVGNTLRSLADRKRDAGLAVMQ
ncbi:hypothetical protein CBR_g30108 [Chara braunii]|uniref:DUF4283 domain-containing protein n=1 Tax=Chara braunii TaxID=69332 RepID=A0A388LCB7_CHABU|nr:hypothetical protein CBR_g30108 [Chara braunii]|eukprot:GBG79843.1 hypothetical protein CBR_g30108 [Chara braunii]